MPAHDCEHGLRLAALLDADDVDAALEAGLMEFSPCPTCDAVGAGIIHAVQAKLAAAWAARDRHRTREARLARIAAERAARRAPEQAQKSALPPAAAAILARAKAKAAQRSNQ